MIKEGESAPDFTIKNAIGENVKLSNFRGKKVVLYFYPKDDTPSCTKQACSLRDGFAELEKANIEVLGISPDDEKSHQKFIAKYDLPFTLLADTNHEVADLYGTYGEKNMYGRKYTGIKRTTFLIDEKGKIVKVFKKVNVSEHADEVLKAFNE